MELLDPSWIRVSSVLGIVPSSGSDGKWSFPMQQIDPGVLQRKAALGTAVHAGIALDLVQDFAILPEAGEGFFLSYTKWCKALKPAPVYIEKRFYCEPMKLTGCVDLMARFGEGPAVHIIDFKCTAQPDHSKWPLQAAFYKFLSSQEVQDVSETCFFVQLDPSGDFPKVHEYLITPEVTRAAISFYNAYIYLTKNKR